MGHTWMCFVNGTALLTLLLSTPPNVMAVPQEYCPPCCPHTLPQPGGISVQGMVPYDGLMWATSERHHGMTWEGELQHHLLSQTCSDYDQDRLSVLG